MRQESNRLKRGFGADVGRGVVKAFLAAVFLAATVGAGGSFSFNICASCAPYRLEEQKAEPAYPQDKKPTSEGKADVSPSDLPPVPEGVRRAP